MAQNAVLKRDGTNVVVGSNCAATSGSWVSPYDNVPTNLASDLDIDHVVPLKEAWVSGARTWTNAQREAFANDLVRPQLIAVTDSLRVIRIPPSGWSPSPATDAPTSGPGFTLNTTTSSASTKLKRPP
uniref:GmrSD restriction endonucleases C-terminal domain-containing protein n=1 Tax=Psilocybe cubensis TaxID=181762 RepID=A0A8H7XR14_PSICU